MARDESCLFCKIIAGEIPCDKVYEDEYVFAFNDINPQAETHVLIVPKNHKETLRDYTEGDCEELGRVLAAAAKIANDKGLGDFRTVVNCGEGAGQTVWHLHLHLLAGRAFGWPPG